MTDLANSLEPPVPQDEIDAAAADAEVVKTPEGEAPKQEPKADVEGKTVPLAALHEERQKRKEIQQQWNKHQQEQAAREAVMQDRLNQLYAIQNPAPQYRDPDRDPDPLQAMAHNERLNAQQLHALQQERQMENARRQQEHQTQQLVGWAQGEAARFKAETPDFDGAYDHMRKLRVGELSAMGWSPQQVAEIVKGDELWVFQNAAQTGQNPAELIYRMAKNTGYASKAEPVIPGDQKIDTLNKGMQAAKTLTAGAQAGKPTPEQIAAMSEDEFAEFKAGLSKKGQRVSDVL